MTTRLESMIREKLYYKDGLLFWRNIPSVHPKARGKEAGSLSGNGYKQVGIEKNVLPQHRVIFFMFHGYWPDYIDHINRVKTDNRIENLRECQVWQNGVNKRQKNSSKYGTNVTYHKRDKKYRVQVHVNKKPVSFGYYDDLELAQLVASEAREKYYGEFA